MARQYMYPFNLANLLFIQSSHSNKAWSCREIVIDDDRTFQYLMSNEFEATSLKYVYKDLWY